MVLIVSSLARRTRATQALLACVFAAAGLVTLAATTGTASAGFTGRDGSLGYDGRWSGHGLISLRRPSGGGLRRLRTPGRPVDPAFSPLGLRIAFATRGQVWVMQADGTSQRQVTSTPLPSADPTWSPDGRSLAFTMGARGARDIYRIDADGAGLRRLTYSGSDATGPAWSSRNRIAFARRSAGGDGDLRVIDATGGGLARVTRGPDDDEMPSWSPDGRRIAFTRGSRSHRDIYVIRADGAQLRRLTRLPHPASSPAWSPDGQSIAFSMGPKGRGALYVVPRAGGRARRVSPKTTHASAVDWQPAGHDPVIAAAGDIACDPADRGFNRGLGTADECHERQTSDVLLGLDLDAILPLGDTQYQSGAPGAYPSFDETWGRLKSLMRPAVGNHESRSPGAAGYYDYFDGVGQADGPAGPRNRGWYSWNLGAWHMVALNSQCSWPGKAPTLTDCLPGSPQERWLAADLAAHPSRCTLVYFHHPLQSSGIVRLNVAVQPLWRDMQAAHVDVVLVGHDHAYERFAPLDWLGQVDRTDGIRQFVVGTGGKSFTLQDLHKPGSELRQASVFGVLEMTLREDAYHWRFVPEAGGQFSDAGNARCH